MKIGEHVVATFLQFDTTNLEARLSLRATRPDPFQAFAERTAPGRALRGRVTKIVPFGFFVEVADGVEGLLHVRDLTCGPGEAADVVQIGVELDVIVADLDRKRRTLRLSLG